MDNNPTSGCVEYAKIMLLMFLIFVSIAVLAVLVGLVDTII